jgi:hypothetical protein
MRHAVAGRVVAEQAGLDLDTREAIAVGSDDCHLLVAQAVLQGNGLELVRLGQQPAKTPDLPRRDFD